MTTIEDLAKAQLAQLQQQRSAYVDQVNQLMTAIASIDKTLAEGQSLFGEKPPKKPITSRRS